MNQPDKEMQDVMEHLSVLAPTPSEAPRPAREALAGIHQTVVRRRENRLVNRLRAYFSQSGRRYALAGAAFVMLFAFSLTFPAVRAAASEFLGLFRVQKFAAISISPDQMALLEQIAQEGVMPGQFEILSQPGDLTAVDSTAEAAEVVEIPVRSLPELGEPVEVYVSMGGAGRLTIDIAGVRAILDLAGLDPLLAPDSLDGARVDAVIHAGVEQRWSDGTWLLQSPSPQVSYPADIDPAVLGKALLQMLGMSDAEAERLSHSIDWTGTLLLPVPTDIASFNEVTVNGVSGLALTSVDGQHGVVMWQDAGVIYLLHSPGNTADLISLANTLQ